MRAFRATFHGAVIFFRRGTSTGESFESRSDNHFEIDNGRPTLAKNIQPRRKKQLDFRWKESVYADVRKR